MFKKLLGLDTVGTVIKARVEAIGSILVAGITSLAAFNFLPYLTGESVNLKVILPVAGYVFLSAVGTEIIRKYKAKDLK